MTFVILKFVFKVFQSTRKSISKAGTGLCVAGIIVFLGIQIAEMNFIGSYSTHANYISELGINNSSSAIIFNLTMIIAGVLIMGAARKFSRNNFKKLFTRSLWLYGLGTLGVGLFNDNNIGVLHGVFAGLLFVTGPIAAFVSRNYSHGGVKRISFVLAAISVLFLVVFIVSNDANNIGGIERLVVYPITMWLIVFGSFMSRKITPAQ